MTMSLLSAAVVVIAVAIAAIGLGATADDVGSDSERKSRLFVVSGAVLVQHCQGERHNHFFFLLLSFFFVAPIILF